MTTYPERVLIVLNQDGTLKAAHQEKMELDADGNPWKQHNAEALDGDTLATILPDAAMMLSQVQGLEAQIVTLTSERDAALGQVTTHEATISGHEATIAAHEATISGHVATISGHEATIESHEATISGHEATIASKDEQIATLNARIAELEATVAQPEPV